MKMMMKEKFETEESESAGRKRKGGVGKRQIQGRKEKGSLGDENINASTRTRTLKRKETEEIVPQVLIKKMSNPLPRWQQPPTKIFQIYICLTCFYILCFFVFRFSALKLPRVSLMIGCGSSMNGFPECCRDALISLATRFPLSIAPSMYPRLLNAASLPAKSECVCLMMKYFHTWPTIATDITTETPEVLPFDIYNHINDFVDKEIIEFYELLNKSEPFESRNLPNTPPVNHEWLKRTVERFPNANYVDFSMEGLFPEYRLGCHDALRLAQQDIFQLYFYPKPSTTHLQHPGPVSSCSVSALTRSQKRKNTMNYFSKRRKFAERDKPSDR
ncbi:hypothetical protein ROZALSC1DRAFT_22849 [Rozella allomycis CSF55]|uniref:Uncharacterized protein n=1 Tax=Rozella allomycis (strain CSF55) TaxID=988480 RepID=A0A4P9YH10_ROZAC|nr:hypothetical protein ROZALSC1DRAFT_22849 [Rozella allomycis CSF55]